MGLLDKAQERKLRQQFPDAWQAGQSRAMEFRQQYTGGYIEAMPPWGREDTLRMIADQRLVFMPGSREAEAFIRSFVRSLKDVGL